LVQARKINEIKVGKISASVWRDVQPPGYSEPKGHHNNFKIEVDPAEGWLCVGGGAKGGMSPGNYLTTSCPADDLGSWIISSRDHTDQDLTPLTGYAIGLKIDGLDKDVLKAHLKTFKEDKSPPSDPSNPSVSAFVRGEFSLLLGGGFEVLDQPPSAGSLATASYSDSTISWKASSKDHSIISPTRIRAYAIGIKPTITKPDGTTFGNVITTFHSSQVLPGAWTPFSSVQPLPGYALCGGGAAAHYGVSMLLWCLEPTPLEAANSAAQQIFGGGSKAGYNTVDWGPITAYAMGIKLGTAPFSPEEPFQLAYDKSISISDVSSPATADGFNPSSVKDNNPNTKWVSTEMTNPSIRLHLPGDTGEAILVN
jgi:hypothetical protein